MIYFKNIWFLYITCFNIFFVKAIKLYIEGPFNNVVATPCGSFLDINYNLGIEYACNIRIKNDDMVAAVSNYQFSYSYHKNNSYIISDVCNKKIKIINIKNNKTIIVYIRDNYLNGENGSLDLTKKAWDMLKSNKDTHKGHMIVNWKWI